MADHLFTFTPPADAKSFRVTLAIPESRFFKFVAKPRFVQGPAPDRPTTP